MMEDNILSDSTHLHGLCWISSIMFIVPQKGAEAASLPGTSYTDATSWVDAASGPLEIPINRLFSEVQSIWQYVAITIIILLLL